MSTNRKATNPIVNIIKNAFPPRSEEEEDSSVIDRNHAIRQLQKIINKQIEDEDKLEKFSNAIEDEDMSIAEVIEYIKILERNDKNTLQEILSKIIFIDEINNGKMSIKEIETLLESVPDNMNINLLTKFTASELVFQILQITLRNFHTLKERKEVLSAILISIPDTFIDIDIKAKLCRELIANIKLNEIKIAYNEPAQPLTKAKTSGNISLSEFKIATKNSDLDYSQFILLALGVMQNIAEKDNMLKHDIDKIQKAYFNTNYEKAITIIIKITKNKLYSSNPMIQAIKNSLPEHTFHEVKLEENFSRRFFENRLASMHQGNLTEFDSVNRIAKFFVPTHPPISNVQDAIQTVTNLAEFKDDKNLFIVRDNLKFYSPIWDIRGRQYKKGFIPRSEERVKKTEDTVLTHNPGVMKSTQPNYPDELSQKPIRNNPSDTYTYDKTIPKSYPSTRPRGAYVSSVSGHAYFVVAMLEKYMKANKNSKTVAIDVNNFIEILTSSYLSSGYHGLFEMIDVFHEPHITAMFKRYGVTVTISWPKEIIEQAFKDTQTYNKQLLMKQAFHEDIKSDKNTYIYTNKIKSIIKNNTRENLTLIINLFKTEFGHLFQDIQEMNLINISKEPDDKKFKTELTNILTKIIKSLSFANSNHLKQVMTFIDVINNINIETLQQLKRNNLLTTQSFHLIARAPNQADQTVDKLIRLTDHKIPMKDLTETQLNLLLSKDKNLTSGMILLHKLDALNDENCKDLEKYPELLHTILKFLTHREEDKLIEFILNYQKDLPLVALDLIFDQIYKENNFELVNKLIKTDHAKVYLFYNDGLDDLLNFIKEKEATSLIPHLSESCQDLFNIARQYVQREYFEEKTNKAFQFLSSQISNLDYDDINISQKLISQFENLHPQRMQSTMQKLVQNNPDDAYLKLKLCLYLAKTNDPPVDRFYKVEALQELKTIIHAEPVSDLNQLTKRVNDLMKNIDNRYNFSIFNHDLLDNLTDPIEDEDFMIQMEEVEGMANKQLKKLEELQGALNTNSNSSQNQGKNTRVNDSVSLLNKESIFSATSPKSTAANQANLPNSNTQQTSPGIKKTHSND